MRKVYTPNVAAVLLRAHLCVCRHTERTWVWKTKIEINYFGHANTDRCQVRGYLQNTSAAK